jgi:hypothetical protein
LLQQRRRQVIPCRIRSAAAFNPITATRSVEAAAKHQPLTQQQLLDLGATFVRCWFAGIAKGPQAVEESLSSILDSNVLLVADRVRQLEDQPVSGLTLLVFSNRWTCIALCAVKQLRLCDKQSGHSEYLHVFSSACAESTQRAQHGFVVAYCRCLTLNLHAQHPVGVVSLLMH